MAKNKQDAMKPVSRKTNEEIDVDDKGNLIIDGEVLAKDNAAKSSSARRQSSDHDVEHLED